MKNSDRLLCSAIDWRTTLYEVITHFEKFYSEVCDCRIQMNFRKYFDTDVLLPNSCHAFVSFGFHVP